MGSRFIQLLFKTYKRYQHDSGGYLAAAITYNAFLAVYPLLLVNLFLLGWLFAGDTASQAAWEGRLFSFVPGIQELLSHNLKALNQARTTLGIIGFAGLIWTGLGMAHAASWSLARIFRISKNQGMIRQTASSLGSLILLSMLVLISAGSSGVIHGAALSGTEKMLLRITSIVITLILDFLIFLMGYRILTPHGKLSIKELWKGALFGGVGWAVIKIGGLWYASFAMSRQRRAA